MKRTTRTTASDTVNPASLHIEFVEVMPAYGRDYKSAAAAKADWDKGLDFVETQSRRYCSKRDWEDAAHEVHVTIRYNNLQRLASAS